MILLIDNYDSFTYNLYQTLATLYPHVEVARNDALTLEQIEVLNPRAIILSPGPGRPDAAGISIPLIQKFYKQIPMLGVCLGHQAIACAFGGNIIQAPQIVHGKSELIFHHRQDIFAKLPLPFAAGRYHSLIVDRQTLPKDLMITAENALGLIMAIRHQHYPVYGVQFHPESILTPLGENILKNFVQQFVEKLGVAC